MHWHDIDLHSPILHYIMNLPHRKSIRLPGYDYSNPGYYFITICIHDRWTDFFGDVVDGEMIENHYATIVRGCWLDLPDHYPHIALDAFVIMPNHIHGILRIRAIPVAPELLGTYCPEQSGIKCDTAIYRKQSGKLEA